MKLVNEFPLFIFVGKWNRELFNVDWVGRFLFPDTEITVELPIDGNITPRFSTENARIIVIRDQLHLYARMGEHSNFSYLQDLIVKVFELLPHTPVSAVGINFIYQLNESEILRSLFQFEDASGLIDKGFRQSFAEIKRKLSHNGNEINFDLKYEAETTYFGQLNFHFPVKSLAEFKQKLSEMDIIDRKAFCDSLLKTMYSQ